jgi:hypothetical protein
MRWEATYRNGTIQRQSEQSTYEDIDRDSLAAFTLKKDDRAVFTLDFSDGDGHSLVWRRRVEQTLGREPIVLHVVGKKGKGIALVYESGEVVLLNNFKEGMGLAYAPEFRDFEVEHAQ